MNRILPGINIQWPISKEIINKKKTVETRTYPLPLKYINQDMYLIETPGKEGKFKARITGIIRFTKCFTYRNKKEFINDKVRHLVEEGSIWDWKDKEKFGWEVKVIKVFKEQFDAPSKRGIKFTTDINLQHLKVHQPQQDPLSCGNIPRTQA